MSFTLSEASTTKLAFARKTVGKKSGKRCVPAKKPPAKKDRCDLYVSAGALTRKSKAGANTVSFTGRVGSKALPRGAYRVTVTATDAAGNVSGPVTATFTVVSASGK